MRCSRWVVPIAGLVVACAAPAAAQSDIREMTILRDGSPVGTHVIDIEGENGTMTVDVKTEAAVKIAFVTLFRFEHERREEWRDGRLRRVESRTDEDGKKYEIVAELTDSGVRRTVNGRTRSYDDDHAVLVYWNRDAILGHRRFVSSILNKTYKVTTESKGVEDIVLPAGAMKAERVEMRGDLDQDFWFDDRGRLLKMRFNLEGSTIEYALSKRRGE